jgi:hypothetical protein
MGLIAYTMKKEEEKEKYGNETRFGLVSHLQHDHA